jgi:hypothetical protein
LSNFKKASPESKLANSAAGAGKKLQDHEKRLELASQMLEE